MVILIVTDEEMAFRTGKNLENILIFQKFVRFVELAEVVKMTLSSGSQPGVRAYPGVSEKFQVRQIIISLRLTLR